MASTFPSLVLASPHASPDSTAAVIAKRTPRCGGSPVTGKERRSWHPAGTDRAQASICWYRRRRMLTIRSGSVVIVIPSLASGWGGTAPAGRRTGQRWAFKAGS